MALVAYDVSESENEEETDKCTESRQKITLNDKLKKEQIIQDAFENKDSESNISKLLPKVIETNKLDLKEDRLEDFVKKKYVTDTLPKAKIKEKVKITIPSLLEFKDEEDDDNEPSTKKQNIAKGSGLLSLLPPVKGSPLTTTSFVPKVISKNKMSLKPTSSSTLMPNVLRKKAEIKKKQQLAKIMKGLNGSDIESDDDIETPETFDEEMWKKVCGRQKSSQEILKPVEEPQELTQLPIPIVDIAPEAVKPYDGLDNKAFKELVGKNKRPHLNYKLIDINEEEIITEKDLLLTKTLTDPDQKPKPVIEEPVDPTRKKKHHITYLAEQAKANEQELQSQWSTNKYSRRQTKAKYGF